MKWDIDRTLRFFRAETQTTVLIGNETVSSAQLQTLGLKVRNNLDSAEIWHLTFGPDQGVQLSFHGFTIHDACIRAVKYLKKAAPEELEALQIKRKPKKPGGYVRGKLKKPSGVEG